MAKKNPELLALLESLRAEREQILAASAPLREARDALRERMAPLQAELAELTGKINAAERPRLAEVDTQISALARALGGRAVKAESAAVAADAAPAG